MKQITICICDGSTEGIFSAIYRAWHIGTSRTRIQIGDADMELFAEYEYVETDIEIAAKVAQTIIDKISRDAYDYMCMAALSKEPDRGEAIYRFMIRGIKMGPRVVEALQDPYVNRVMKLQKNVWYENHHFLGFIRFEEINRILVAKFEPKNDVLMLVANHFEDRLSVEDWVIIDSKRMKGVFHKAGYPGIMMEVTEEQIEKLTFGKDKYIDMWKSFFDAIAIRERENYELQRNNLPIRFRTYMVEFNK